ncbi:putative membrane-anchored protein YjiN, DUF445 family, partial [Sesbania bispinosa]
MPCRCRLLSRRRVDIGMSYHAEVKVGMETTRSVGDYESSPEQLPPKSSISRWEWSNLIFRHQCRVAMAARQHEKLAERRATKALRDGKKKADVTEMSESDINAVSPQNVKRLRVDIPVPPPQNKPLGDGLTKG